MKVLNGCPASGPLAPETKKPCCGDSAAGPLSLTKISVSNDWTMNPLDGVIPPKSSVEVPQVMLVLPSMELVGAPELVDP
jgi:hypothetical protein